VQSVQRLATGWTAEGSDFESRQGRDFSLLHVVQTGSGMHLGSYPMYTGGRAAGAEADHSPLTSAEVKNTSTPLYAFMTWYVISLAQGQVYLFIWNACR
jgi:hypothetical protein